jgi:hypothetical protein
MRDALTAKQIKRVLSPAVQSDANTALVGQVIDHQGFDSATYIILTGGLTDATATFAVKLEESDDSGMSGANEVADGDMVSQTRGTAAETAAAFDFSNDNEVRSLGYIGTKRYTRLTITPSGNDDGDINLAAVCVLELPAHQPVTKAAA